MSKNELFPVSTEWAQRALVDEAGYQEMYRKSIDNPEEFWGEHGNRIDWITPFKQVRFGGFEVGDAAWFVGGQLPRATLIYYVS